MKRSALLIMAAGTPADTLRLASGVRIGGLWRFATAADEAARMDEMQAVLRPHGLRLAQMIAPDVAVKRYGVTRALQVLPTLT